METKKNNFYLLKINIPAAKMMGATCKAIRDMHRSHHGNEEAGWIRNQLKRDPGKLIPT